MADRSSDTQKKKPLMRSLGEFVGHIVKAVRTEPGPKRIPVNRTTHEEKRGDVTLRRTTIEEIEIRDRPESRSDG